MPEIETVDHDETKQHLALVRALSGEVSNAISAIERNDMTRVDFTPCRAGSYMP